MGKASLFRSTKVEHGAGDSNNRKTLVIDCNPGIGIEEILQRFASQESRCKIRTAEAAKALMDSGKAKSEREAAKQIAAEIGDNEQAVRKRIERGKKAQARKMATPVASQDGDQEAGGAGPAGGKKSIGAMERAKRAIFQLGKITDDDPEKDDAFLSVAKWIVDQRGSASFEI